MAASNIAIGAVIGGVVGATFGKALSDSSAKIKAFQQKTERVRVFHNLIGDTIRLRQEMQKTTGKSVEELRKLWKANDANSARLKSHGLAVGNLEKEYARLGRTVKGLELGAAGRQKIGEGVQQFKDSLKLGTAITAAVAAPTMVSANYQAIIRDIAIKGGIARTDKEGALSESIRKDAADTGIGRNELAEAVNTLVAGGMGIEEASAQARTMAKFSVGQNADSTDTAKLVLALRQAGVTDPKAIETALGKIAVAGDLGSFEAKNMAKHFVSLMPQMTVFGMAGEQASVELANMLQTQMKAAGSADEAANNLANLLGKLTAGDTVKKFEKQGIDFKKSMQVNIARGYDPISAFLGIVQESASQTDPAQAKEMATLQSEIARAQDPVAAQKMLDSYLAMAGLSEYISDRNAKQAALAALQNQNLHRENLKTIQTTDGLAKIEKDLADRRAASARMWEEVGNALDETLARVGDAIRPLTDLAATGIKWLAEGIGGLAKEFPNATSGILGLGAAFAAVKIGAPAFKISSGLVDVVRGGWNVLRGGRMPVFGESFSRMGGTRTRGSGRGGKAPAVADILGVATGAGGTPVFVTNWPGGGRLGDRVGKGGFLSRARGQLSRSGSGATKLISKIPGIGGPLAAKAGISGMSMFGAGAGSMGAAAATAATSLAALAAAGAAGYGTGRLIDKGFEKAAEGTRFAGAGTDVIGGGLARIGAFFGHENAKRAIEGSDYDPNAPASAEEMARFARFRRAPVPAAASPALAAPVSGVTSPAKPAAAPPQNLTFAPKIDVTVQGDAKDPRQLANELMPHLTRMFEDFRRQVARGGLYDAAATP